MNKYIAIGNLTQDPNCRDVGEAKVCSFGIAINEFYYKNNEKQKTTLFLDVEAWNRQAENCTKFLSKGKKVAIEGKVHFLASEDSSNSNSNSAKPSRPTKEDMSNQEKVENTDNEVDDIDDIPF